LLGAFLQPGEKLVDVIEIARGALAVALQVSAELQIVLDRHGREDLAAFGDLHDATRHEALDAGVRDVGTVEFNRTFARRHEPGDTVKGRGLSGAIGA
jgi:hypothetical protein